MCHDLLLHRAWLYEKPGADQAAESAQDAEADRDVSPRGNFLRENAASGCAVEYFRKGGGAFPGILKRGF